MRRNYRDMLFTMPDFGSYFSGVILYDERSGKTAATARASSTCLRAAGSFPGIKLDTGTHPLPLAGPDEKITEGLDGLAKRVDEYVKMGAKFAKWRAVIAIDAKSGIPTDAALHANAHAARAVCRHLPGRRPRADRRTGSSQRRQRGADDRAKPRGSRAYPPSRLQRTAPASTSNSKKWCSSRA